MNVLIEALEVGDHRLVGDGPVHAKVLVHAETHVLVRELAHALDHVEVAVAEAPHVAGEVGLVHGGSVLGFAHAIVKFCLKQSCVFSANKGGC